jgi:hypothetical protein
MYGGWKMAKILFLFIGIYLVLTDLISAYNLDEYCPLEQGNNWIYLKNETGKTNERITFVINGNEIVSNEKTVKMFSSDENGYECYSIDSEGVKLFKNVDDNLPEIFTPPKMIIPNLEIGEEKKYQVNGILYNKERLKIREVRFIDTFLLESTIANVEVPAGEFDNCLKFSVISKADKSDGMHETQDCSIWLAHHIGRIKESCFCTEYNQKSKTETTSTTAYELISAFVNGKQIGREQLPIDNR